MASVSHKGFEFEPIIELPANFLYRMISRREMPGGLKPAQVEELAKAFAPGNYDRNSIWTAAIRACGLLENDAPTTTSEIAAWERLNQIIGKEDLETSSTP